MRKLRKNLISSRFQQDRRYDIDIYMHFPRLDRNAIIADISEGGSYLFLDFPVNQGEEHHIVIFCGNFHIALTARIMRVRKETDIYYGCGLMFINRHAVEKEGLHRLIGILENHSKGRRKNYFTGQTESRRSERYRLPGDFLIEKDGETLPVFISDISKKGCSFRAALQMPVGAVCRLILQDNGTDQKLDAAVIWKKEGEELSRYGLRFSGTGNGEKQTLVRLIREARALGAEKRA